MWLLEENKPSCSHQGRQTNKCVNTIINNSRCSEDSEKLLLSPPFSGMDLMVSLVIGDAHKNNNFTQILLEEYKKETEYIFIVFYIINETVKPYFAP